ncbi:DUF1799 domain-containing protein [Iodobacter sp. CM08]|uniref:DUF1799 domain-containing protein n=1 Tax=Iodobacter sp. CM08 TaxID=3085902 RepID=UPI0029814A73|nr:DUF1799 domain-containing protein [Iodobacter sp. CM08]MDW5417747.1 DUF1799 domain-containing protein [Iodobacter sp. CM08]
MAARTMVGGKQPAQQDDAAVLGVVLPADWLAGKEETELWPELIPVVQFFSSCVTQWRVGAGGAVGLDYLAIKMIADTQGLAWNHQLLSDIQQMEHEVLTALTSR